MEEAHEAMRGGSGEMLKVSVGFASGVKEGDKEVESWLGDNMKYRLSVSGM